MATPSRRKIYLATTLNPDEADAFDRIAAELGLNRVELLRQVVRDYVDQWAPPWDTIEADWEPNPQPDRSADILQRLDQIEARLQALEEQPAPPLALPPPSRATLEPGGTVSPQHPAPLIPQPEPMIIEPPRPISPPAPPPHQSPDFSPKTASIYQAATLKPDQLCRRFNIERRQIIQSARLLGVKQSAYLEDLTGWRWDAIAHVFRA